MSWQWLWTEWLWPVASRLWSLFQGSAAPPRPVVADRNSIVNTTKMKNVKAKSLTMKMEGVSGPGGGSSEKALSQTPGTYYNATDGGLINDPDLSDLDIEGEIIVSAEIKPSQPQ